MRVDHRKFFESLTFLEVEVNGWTLAVPRLNKEIARIGCEQINTDDEMFSHLVVFSFQEIDSKFHPLTFFDELREHRPKSPQIAWSRFRANTMIRAISEYAAKATNPRVAQTLFRYVDLCNSKSDLPTKVQEPGEVFANNYLHLGHVNVVGFDLDYTLVNYTKKLQGLLYDLAKQRLVTVYGYPQQLHDAAYDPDFAIRGLAVDLQAGVICKLSQVHRVSLKYVFKGHRRLKPRDIIEMYGESRHISQVYRNNNLRPLNDLYSLAEACLLSDTMDFFDQSGVSYDPRAVVEDIQSAIVETHNSGKMHQEILDNMEEYIETTPLVRPWLERLKSSDKKLFVSSNSGYLYMKQTLNYTIGPDWQELFDVVITGAQKPRFYTGTRQFRKINALTGMIDTAPVTSLDRGMIYTYGSLEAMRKMTGWEGPRVLYIGDNMWADLVEARRAYGWSTGAIIDELDHEIKVQSSGDFIKLATIRTATREVLRQIQYEFDSDRRRASSPSPVLTELGVDEDAIIKIMEKQLMEVNNGLQRLFNKNFGSIFRTEGHPTLFAFSVRRYIDVYAASLSDFEKYGVNHRFYPLQSMGMPHDPAIELPPDLQNSLNCS